MQAAALVLFYTTQAQQLLVKEGLPASPTHSRPARLSAPGQPGVHAGPPVLPPMWRKSPSSPSLAAPAPQRVPRHRQVWHHAGCTAAKELAGRGEKVKQEQPGRPGRRNGLGQERAPMGELCKATCSSQGQASTFFPLVSNCTQASPMCCPSYVPSSSLYSQRTAVHCGPRYASGQQELPLRKAACTGLGHWRDSGGVQHTLREREGVSPAKGLPSQAAGMVGKKKKGPVAGVRGWTDPGSVHPSPKQGCSELHAGQGTEAGAGSQPCHSSWQIPTPPLASAPGRAPSSHGAGEGPCPICLALPVQPQVPPAASARSTLKVESQPQEPAVAQLLLQC